MNIKTAILFTQYKTNLSKILFLSMLFFYSSPNYSYTSSNIIFEKNINLANCHIIDNEKIINGEPQIDKSSTLYIDYRVIFFVNKETHLQANILFIDNNKKKNSSNLSKPISEKKANLTNAKKKTNKKSTLWFLNSPFHKLLGYNSNYQIAILIINQSQKSKKASLFLTKNYIFCFQYDNVNLLKNSATYIKDFYYFKNYSKFFSRPPPELI